MQNLFFCVNFCLIFAYFYIMEYIFINKDNIDNHHICCALWTDKRNTLASEHKKSWMKDRFEEGLEFIKWDVRWKVFIEFGLAETMWKPVIAPDYMMINCIWVAGKYAWNWHWDELLNMAINRAKELGKKWLVVVSSDKNIPFLTEKKFYLKHWFKEVDRHLDFVLLALNFEWNDTSDLKIIRNTPEKFDWLVLYYSHQCPFTEEYAHIIVEEAKNMWLEAKAVLLKSKKEVDKYACPFGTNTVYLWWEFLTHSIMSVNMFRKLIDKKFKK